MAAPDELNDGPAQAPGQTPPAGPDVGRRRLLQGGAAIAPAVLTLVSTPVRATYYTTPASSFASINTSRPSKPIWWKNCAMTSWPASCKDGAGNPKKFKECFADHATYGNKTLLECVQLAYDTGTDGLVKHLCAAYLNASSGKTPHTICSTITARNMWASYVSKGYYEPTAGIRWFADTCSPAGNGGCTPWLKTTMPYS
jgi:hypothetical protein